eukprot:INCI7243.7.p1 GENE.INCI7243.7~~INCI7243.7.p1  ORF type:complete len:1049 (-),score=187.32 INCI7243.7:1983-5129(-)
MSQEQEQQQHPVQSPQLPLSMAKMARLLEPATPKSPATRSRTCAIAVEGMMCQKSCGSTVAEALRGVAGAEQVTVSFEHAGAIVTGTAEMFDLIEAVESVGFGATPRTYLQLELATGRTSSTLDHSTLAPTNASGDVQRDDMRKQLHACLQQVPGVLASQVSISQCLAIVDGPVNATQLIDAVGKLPFVMSASSMTVSTSKRAGEVLHRLLGANMEGIDHDQGMGMEAQRQPPFKAILPARFADAGSESTSSSGGSDSSGSSGSSSDSDSHSCDTAPGAQSSAIAGPVAEFSVEGMMCQNSCASTVANAVFDVQGVVAVAVSHAKKRALVSGAFDPMAVAEAISDVGFEATLRSANAGSKARTTLRAAAATKGPGVLVRCGKDTDSVVAELSIEGMMCQNSCASTVAAAIEAVPGVHAVAVSHAKRRALVQGTIDLDAIVEAIEDVGFEAAVVTRDGGQILAQTLKDELLGGGGGVLSRRSPAQLSGTNGEVSGTVQEPRSTSDQTANPTSRMWIRDYVVSGIVCAACAGRIEKAVRSLDGISVVRVGVITEKLHVCFDADLQSHSVIEAAVENLGYTLTCVRSVAAGDGKRKLGDPEELTGGGDGHSGPGSRSHILLVTGMTCANCAGKIERALHSLSGVTHVAVSVTTNRVNVQVDAAAAAGGQPAGVRTIVETVQALGFGATLVEEDDELMAIQKSRSREIAQWRVDLIICIVFTVPLLLIKLFWTSSTTGTSDELSAAADETPGMGLFSNVQPQVWVMWLLASPVQFYVGKRFYQKAFYGLRAGCSMGMDFLVASGTSFAYGYSVVSVMAGCADPSFHGKHFFETSGMLITFVVLGKFLEAAAKARTSNSLTELMSIKVKQATLIQVKSTASSKRSRRARPNGTGGDISSSVVDILTGKTVGELQEVEVHPKLLQPGDFVKVQLGQIFPGDGEVVKGCTSVDESMITGESLPVLKNEGDSVFAATINKTATAVVRITSTGGDTALSQIIKLIQDAQGAKAPIQEYADRIAGIFAPTVLALAAISFFLLVRDLHFRIFGSWICRC